jgi:hypothetical protein
MILYHEVSSDSLGNILRHGLKCTERGEKSNDESIIQADHYLDKHRPSKLKKAGLSRSSAVYAFIGTTDTIIDIKNGTIIPLNAYSAKSESAIVRLDVEVEFCYVSDLDKYDAVKSALSDGNELLAYNLAQEYWNSIIPFATFQPDDIARPEVMIIRDVPPDKLFIKVAP